MFSTVVLSELKEQFGNRLRLCSPYHIKVDNHNLWTGKHGTCFQLRGQGSVQTGKISTFIRQVKEYQFGASDQGQLEATLSLLSNIQPDKVTVHTAFTDASIKNGRTRIANVLIFTDDSIQINSRILLNVQDINEAEWRSIQSAIYEFGLLNLSGSDFVIYNDNKTAVRRCNVDNVLWKPRNKTKAAHRAAAIT